MKTSLEHKTIRPGSLSAYSFYYSKRLPAATSENPKKSRTFRLPLGKLFLLLAVILAGYFGFLYTQKLAKNPSSSTSPAANAIVNNPCRDNTLNKFIKVSISQRHLWACTDGKQLYSSAVITGMEQYASTTTPTGTYKIYAKQQGTVLTGSDETGSWRDPVSYWMPFLDNQYGTYGFHDATWRDNSQFGNVDVHSNQASHGCVELPLTTAAWLYGWADVGTVLTIQA